MTSGELRHRVTIQVRTEVSDGHDGYTETWAARHRRWPAQIQPLSGRDLERARQIDPRISHQVRLRYWRDYRADLDAGQSRLVYHSSDEAADDRTLEIVGPPLDLEERHVELRLLCREAA